MTRHVTVELTEAQAAVLDSEAAREAKPIEAIVTDLIQRQVDYDTWFRAEVQKGIDQADRGEGVSHADVVARAAKRRDELLSRKPHE
jgi:predicted transcriptional regulator